MTAGFPSTVGELLRARADDPRPGLLFEDRSWSWAEVVASSAARAAWFAADRSARGADGPPADGSMPAGRGVHVRVQDDDVRAYLAELGDRVDGASLTAAWEDAVAAPAYDGAPVWVHGDLLPGNLLVDGGRLSGVIDFGALGTGDPAPDLLPLWCVVPPGERAAFREGVDLDDDTWRRGRGWALGPALTGIPYYWDTVPAFAQRGLRTLEVVLADLAR